MALDPSILAALSAGAKAGATSSDWETWRSNLGGGEKQGAWNLGQGIIDILSTGGYATAGLTSAAGQGVAALQRGDVGAAWDLANPLSLVEAAGRGVSERRTYSKNLQDMGVDRNTSVWLGLALDIGLDPTTYITGGALAGVRGAAQGAKLATEASKAGKVVSPTKTDFVPVNRELSRDEKLGNLLAGISKGYETGKTQYKLSIKNNKLTKIQKRKARALEALPLGEVGITDNFARTAGGSAALSKVEKLTTKEQKAGKEAAKAAAKAKASVLPGVTAGLSKAAAAKLASDNQAIIGSAEKAEDGTFRAVVRTKEGIVENHSFAKRPYKTEANALKAAEKAAKEVEDGIRGGANYDVKISTTAPEAIDEVARGALRPEEGSSTDQRILRELAQGSKLKQELNQLAKTQTRPGVYLRTRELNDADAARLEELKEDFLQRIDEFWQVEQAALKTSPNKVAKSTIDDLVKYVNAPAKTATRNDLYEQLLAAPVRIPSSFTALARALSANGVDLADVNIGDLIYLVNSTDQLVANQAREAFALAKNVFEEASASAGLTIKPWIDGVVTPRDAESAMREMVDLIFNVRKGSRVYKAIVAAMTKAFEGRLRKAAGGADEPLTANEVEDVFESFLAGADITRVINDIGIVDLQKMADETYDGIEELVDDLQSGKLTLNEFARQDLARIMGVPINQVHATLAKVFGNVDGLGRILDPEMLAQHLSKGPIAASDAVTATGNVAGNDVAALAESAMGLDNLEDIAQQAADITAPMPNTTVPAEATAEFVTMRQQFAADLQTAITDYIAKAGADLTDLQVRAKAIDAVKTSIVPSIIDQIKVIAKNADKTLDDALEEILSGDLRVITEDPTSFTVGGAIKLDELGTHGRFDVTTRVRTNSKATKALYRKSDAESVKKIANREAYFTYLIESVVRALGIPVRSTESMAAALRREGVVAGSKEAKNVKPQYSSVTYSDIAKLAVDQGNEKLIFDLARFRGTGDQGYGLGNFMPNSIESAWLRIKGFKNAGASFEKSSENYDEILYAFNNIDQAVKNKETGRRVGVEFAPANHVRYAEKTPAAAAEINKITDDAIKFLTDNYDELKRIDDFRENLIVAANAQAIYANSARVFAGVIRFSKEFDQLKELAKAGDTSDSVLTESFGKILADHDDLINRLTTGTFSDQSLAINTAGVIKSILMNTKAAGFPNMKALAQHLANTLAMTRATEAAYQGAKAAGKSQPEAERIAKSARTTQISKELTETFEITSEQLSRANTAGNATPAASEDLSAGVLEVSLHAPFVRQQTRLVKAQKALSGNFGMREQFKTILSAAEQRAISWSNKFSLRLKTVYQVTRGRKEDVNTAFKALQDFRKESAAADELGETLDLEQFLAGRNVDREIYDFLDESLEALLGSESVFGAARSFGIMNDELNVALRQFGLKGIQVGDSRTLDDFWLDYDASRFPDSSPIEFLNLLNLSIHRAATRVLIANEFNTFIGKTATEIKEAGENLADYVKIKDDTAFSQVLGESNKLVHKDDFERLKYVQEYLNYDSVLSEGAVARLVEIADRITYVLKTSNTLLRIGHHVTTVVGETAMNALAGVRLSSYNNTARILNRFRPGQYANDGEPFKAYAELKATKGKTIKATEFDNVYWIKTIKDGENTKQVREIIPDKILFDLAERNGVLVSPGGSLEDFITAGDMSFKGAYASYLNAMNKIAVFASHRDNFFRLTHFIDELTRTVGAKSLEEAALSAGTVVRQWHPTSGSLSTFERTYARRAVYFYTWQRVALTRVIMTMLEKPGIVTIPSKIQYAFADANGMNPESFGDPWDPDGIYASWHTGQMWGPQFQGPAGEGDSWGIQPAIQPIDVVGQVVKPFTLQPGEDPLGSMAQGAGDLLGNNLNPILKTLIESSAGSRLGEGGDLPGAPEYLLGQIGVVSTLSKVTGIGQDPDPYETPEQRAENNNRLIANLLLGQRITDYSTPATQYKWTLDQQETMRRMAE